MPDGSTTVIIQGRKRFEIQSITHDEPFILAEVSYLNDEVVEDKKQLKALMGSMKDLAEQIIRLSPNIPSESSVVLKNIKSLSFLTHFIASNLSLEMKEKQKILEINGII